jgi:protoporphyrinogen oxidase
MGISDMLVDCCKEELTTDGVFIAASHSVRLSVCPTQAPLHFLASAFHINALSFVHVYVNVMFTNTEQKQWFFYVRLPFD